jgi:DNA-binding beta-propeller fold protein YncE
MLFGVRSGLVVSLGLYLAGCASTKQGASSPAQAGPSPVKVRAIPLPGAGAEGVFMDYLAYDRSTGRVWVPAGNTGSVDVIEVATDAVTRLSGFPTAEVERKGHKRVVGPSSATVSEGVVYVGNRADSSVCAIDAKSLARGACGTLASMPDGLAYVAATKEVWATTPRDSSISILDATSLAVSATLHLDGQPEGYAIDRERGLFFTNLEDKDKTLAIDIHQRRVIATWQPACGEDGPKGLAFDQAGKFLLVACADHIETLDAGNDGRLLSRLDTGSGVDNIDYVEETRRVYVGAGKAATLAVATLGAGGTLSMIATSQTRPGARNAVATPAGVAYLTDSAEGSILVVAPLPVP